MAHASVLLKASTDWLIKNPDGFYLDCTGGAGGHSAEILSRLSLQGRLWICDYHQASVQKLRERFAGDDRVHVLQSRFSQVFDNLNFSFDGILADLGISSPQLEDALLGIGFMLNDSWLDMRIDDSLTITAADLLKTTPEKELADIFYHFGGETAARKIARSIVADRKDKIFYTTTTELRQLCERVMGRYYRGKKIHPATKVFQALRIAVNRELEELAVLLKQAPQRLKPHGRLCIISFHSGEDSLVKTEFRTLNQGSQFQQLTKKAVKPSEDELAQNPRARSSRLRVLERRGDS